MLCVFSRLLPASLRLYWCFVMPSSSSSPTTTTERDVVGVNRPSACSSSSPFSFWFSSPSCLPYVSCFSCYSSPPSSSASSLLQGTSVRQTLEKSLAVTGTARTAWIGDAPRQCALLLSDDEEEEEEDELSERLESLGAGLFAAAAAAASAGPGNAGDHRLRQGALRIGWTKKHVQRRLRTCFLGDALFLSVHGGPDAPSSPLICHREQLLRRRQRGEYFVNTRDAHRQVSRRPRRRTWTEASCSLCASSAAASSASSRALSAIPRRENAMLDEAWLGIQPERRPRSPHQPQSPPVCSRASRTTPCASPAEHTTHGRCQLSQRTHHTPECAAAWDGAERPAPRSPRQPPSPSSARRAPSPGRAPSTSSSSAQRRAAARAQWHQHATALRSEERGAHPPVWAAGWEQ